MRSGLAIAVAAVLLAASAAKADRRVFIIANDGYEGSRCTAGNQRCGVAAATAYCKSRDFSRAVSFQKVDRDEITGAVPVTATASCRRGGDCDHFIAIVCAR
jgi:hypothetical protein